jgi:uncharacterized membrane protein
MAVLILGLILFLGIHSVSIINSQWRTDVVARFGEIPWKAGYGLVALLGFYLIVSGYAMARMSPIVIYEPPIWMRHISLLLMLPVFTLLLAAYLPGRIQSATKHPMLLAVKIWATAHLLANGTVADLLLFGTFLAWAIADRISLKRRVTPTIYGAPASPVNDAIAIVGGIALYLLFMFWLHRALMGVAPIG